MKVLRTEKKHDALLDGGYRHCSVAAAMIGAAVVGGVASNMAAGKAAGAQTDAANQANDTSNRQYDLTRQDQLAQYNQQRTDQLALLAQQRADAEPYRQAGFNGLAQIQSGMAPGGQFSHNFGASDFTADPGYQFRLSQGEQAINRSAAARGGFDSGATLKALQRFNSDQASQEYGNAYSRFNTDKTTNFNRLASLAGIGQTANTAIQGAGTSAYGAIGAAGNNAFGTIASAGNANSSNIQNNLIGAGNARASGYVGGANAITGAISQGINYYQNQNLLNSLQSSPTPGAANPYGYNGAGYPTDSSGSLQFDP